MAWVYLLSNFDSELRTTHHLCSKIRYRHSRSSKVVDFGGNRTGTWDLPRTYLAPFPRLGDLIGWKSQIFPTPSYSAPSIDRGDPFRICGKPSLLLLCFGRCHFWKSIFHKVVYARFLYGGIFNNSFIANFQRLFQWNNFFLIRWESTKLSIWRWCTTFLEHGVYVHWYNQNIFVVNRYKRSNAVFHFPTTAECYWEFTIGKWTKPVPRGTFSERL